jgi:hypothetical protein
MLCKLPSEMPTVRGRHGVRSPTYHHRVVSGLEAHASASGGPSRRIQDAAFTARLPHPVPGLR